MGKLITIPEYTIGVDEVGLGALAGPLTVCAFAAPRGWRGLQGLDDSKALGERTRSSLSAKLWRLIVEKKAFCCIQNWNSQEIDMRGVGVIHRIAITNAVRDMTHKLRLALVSDVIIDGNLDFRGVHPNVRSVIKADSKFNVVRAASVIAKVHRDNQMAILGGITDPYGFSRHKGYPTREHTEALMSLGPSEQHRFSYAPVKKAAGR